MGFSDPEGELKVTIEVAKHSFPENVGVILTDKRGFFWLPGPASLVGPSVLCLFLPGPCNEDHLLFSAVTEQQQNLQSHQTVEPLLSILLFTSHHFAYRKSSPRPLPSFPGGCHNEVANILSLF